jgi:hypothetical protein
MHTITHDNYAEANEAIRDILMMYVDMTAYNGFGHGNTVHIRFDRLKFIDAVSDDKAYYVDMDLLNAGSAVAFISDLYDRHVEGEIVVATDEEAVALETRRLSAFPDIEAVAKEALRRRNILLDDSWFDDALQPIYRKYVLAFFKQLSECDRPS